MERRFTIKWNYCGNETITPCLIPENEEIALSCGECGNQELYDYDLDYDDNFIE